jgi:rubrerythrin
MKARYWMWLPLLLAGFVVGLAVSEAQMKHYMNRKTMENLHTSMKGEAFAYAKYMLYAEHARKNGHPEIADMFESAAKTERFEHFAEEAELAGLVGTVEENLRDAIKGEDYEITTMYKQFSEEARSLEDHDAAERFEEVRQDEIRHRAMFQGALDKLARAREGNR